MNSIWQSQVVQHNPALVGVGMLVGAGISVYVLYKMALPKMLPGIPYNESASKSIWGDLPSLVQHMTEHNTVLDWMTSQCSKLGSPIVQVAVFPMGRPMVVLSDRILCEDILLGRIRELDRSNRIYQMFSLLIPNATICMTSHDQFKNKRRMWQGTMSPTFLQDIAAPHTYDMFSKLVKLWQRKQALASGHPFSVSWDIGLCTADTIWAISYGQELGAVESQLQYLNAKESIPLPSDPNAEVEFPRADVPELYSAIMYLIRSIEPNTLSMKVRNFIVSLTPTFRKHWKIKEDAVTSLIKSSREKFNQREGKPGKINCAMDQVIEREAASYSKHGALYMDDRAMKDEIFMFLLGGFETVLATLQWAFQFVADHPHVQEKLHSALKSAFPDATLTNPPSVSEILAADVPYLDAVMTEIQRVAQVAGGVTRQAMVDCEILGHHIPKGTEVLLALMGESYLFDENLPRPSRLPGTEDLEKRHIKEWPAQSIRKFDPERWLVINNGKQTFDSSAGPSLPFSTGMRGCFGKKLAQVELRISLVLFSWSFHFESIPDTLNTRKANEVITRVAAECYINPTPR